MTTPCRRRTTARPELSAPFYHYASLLWRHAAKLRPLVRRLGCASDDMWTDYQRGACLPSAVVAVVLHEALGVSLDEQEAAIIKDVRRCLSAQSWRCTKSRKPKHLMLTSFSQLLRSKRRATTHTSVTLLNLRHWRLARWKGPSVDVSEATFSRLETGHTLPNVFLFVVLRAVYGFTWRDMIEALLRDVAPSGVDQWAVNRLAPGFDTALPT